MVTGLLRTVLWVLGSLAGLWLLLGLISLVAMSATGGMMQGPGMGMGGMDEPQGMGMGMDGRVWMFTMMGAMVAALAALLGLVGVFIYLVVDTVRNRRGQAAD